jgi:hypothetical protein
MDTFIDDSCSVGGSCAGLEFDVERGEVFGEGWITGQVLNVDGGTILR